MTVIVMLLVMTFLAVLVRVIPGDPVTAILGPRADPALIAQVRHQLELDQPVTTQISTSCVTRFRETWVPIS